MSRVFGSMFEDFKIRAAQYQVILISEDQYFLIPVQLKQLLDNALFWYENKILTPDEIAIRFKHELVSIHCFPNGNGRHSRLMADLIMEKLYNKSFLTWGSSNLVKATEKRKAYIEAIKMADNLDLTKLILFAKS